MLAICGTLCVRKESYPLAHIGVGSEMASSEGASEEVPPAMVPQAYLSTSVDLAVEAGLPAPRRSGRVRTLTRAAAELAEQQQEMAT